MRYFQRDVLDSASVRCNDVAVRLIRTEVHMFGSTSLDIAIGLVLMFFLLALLSSSIVEAIAGLLKVRSKNLEGGIRRLVSDPAIIQHTSVYKALAGPSKVGAKAKPPSYMSAKAFADAVVEGITNIKATVATADDLAAQLPDELKARLDTLSHEVGTDLTRIKAGLESWFDNTMDRVSGIYKRWAQIVLFIVGLVITVGLNASATRVTATLWNNPQFEMPS